MCLRKLCQWHQNVLPKIWSLEISDSTHPGAPYRASCSYIILFNAGFAWKLSGYFPRKSFAHPNAAKIRDTKKCICSRFASRCAYHAIVPPDLLCSLKNRFRCSVVHTTFPLRIYVRVFGVNSLFMDNVVENVRCNSHSVLRLCVSNFTFCVFLWGF